jgi:hypothetical protein
MKRAEPNFACGEPMAFGEVLAKQSQDDKPLTHQRLVRTASVGDGIWSQPPLRSRRGREVSATWPLLSRLSSAPPIPARPFGLRSRCDGALLIPAPLMRGLSRQKYQAKNARAGPRYHRKSAVATFTDKAYLWVNRIAVPSAHRPSSRTIPSPGAHQARSGAFARSGPMPSQNSQRNQTLPIGGTA